MKGLLAGPISWEDVVPRFRALRESLLSNSAQLPFFTAVLEASSDACLHAGNFAEYLKSVQQLVLVSYPALAATVPVRAVSPSEGMHVILFADTAAYMALV